MNWQMDDDELVEHLKHLPDFPMKPESKNKMLKELVRMEQIMKPRNMHMRRVSMQRVLGTTLASAAGIALFAAGIMGYSHFGSQRGALPNTSTSKPPTPTHAVQPTYFGYRAPFQPLIPTVMASGYKLNNSIIYMTFKNGKTQFSNYMASYTKGNTPTSGRIEFPPITISEAVGNSVTQYQPVGNAHTTWTKFAKINNQTYYATNPTKFPNADAVGFVKNNVVYGVKSPPGINLSQSALLKYAESITKVAPIQALDTSAMGYKDALNNISFHPFLPTTLDTTYKVASATSDVTQTTKGITQEITVEYAMKSNPRKIFMVIEGPLNNVDNQQLFSHAVGYVPTWKDFKRGLEFRLMGNTSSTEFHRVLNLLRSSN